MKNPFKYPKAAVIVGVQSDKATFEPKGKQYGLKEDASLEDIYHKLTTLVGARAQRSTYFKHINPNDR